MLRRLAPLLVAFLLLEHIAWAAASSITISAGSSGFGINGVALSTSPASLAIDMETSFVTNQLSLTLAVTPGTTTRIRVFCSEGETSTVNTMGVVNFCDGVAPVSNCVPDIREFILANYTAVSGVKYITARWPIKKHYAACTPSDPDAGNGTVVVTGSRTWQ